MSFLVDSPSKPREIPYNAQSHSHQMKRKTRPRDICPPNQIPTSLKSLLASTDIPLRRNRSVSQASAPVSRNIPFEQEKPAVLMAAQIMQEVNERELSMALAKSPLDMLLLPPEELCREDTEGLGSRTVSLESMPSVADSFVYGTPSSVGSGSWEDGDGSPGVGMSRSRQRVRRPSLEVVRAGEDVVERHPLEKSPVSSPSTEPEEYPLVIEETIEQPPTTPAQTLFPKTLKYALKSNLTSSFRLLKNAAKSLGTINFTSIPPDDLITRSILSIDPNVPFTDERRPPPLSTTPDPALRRYLNPTSTARLSTVDALTPVLPTRTYTASIQMQTYKICKSRLGTKPAALPMVQAPPSPVAQPSRQPSPPPMRPREMRENPAFIRIAVLEMAMRRNGKFEDGVPGRARWALPPRKPVRVCEVCIDGVPERWVPTL